MVKSNGKARVAPVQIGKITIEGLLLPSNESGKPRFAIAAPQVARLFSLATQKATRKIKSLLGKDCSLATVSSELNSKPVNILSLEQFDVALIRLALEGNQIAVQMLLELAGLSLHQLFCDSFKIKFDADDRQEWLIARQESKALFWELSQEVKRWVESRECSQPPATYFVNAQDAVNLVAFGKRSRQIREELGLEKGQGLIRDHYGRTAIRRLTTIQEAAANAMKLHPDLRPVDAVKMIPERIFVTGPIDFRA